MKSAKVMRLVAMVAVSVVLAIIACGPSAMQHQSEGDGAVDRTPESGGAVIPGSKDFVQLTSWLTQPPPVPVSSATPTLLHREVVGIVMAVQPADSEYPNTTVVVRPTGGTEPIWLVSNPGSLLDMTSLQVGQHIQARCLGQRTTGVDLVPVALLNCAPYLPPPTPAPTSTPVPALVPETYDVMEIVEAYFDNQIAAKQKYDDRPLLVQGTVREIMEQGIEFTTLKTIARPGAISARDMYWKQKMWELDVVFMPLASAAFEPGNLHQLASLTRLQKVTLLCDDVEQLDETTAFGGCQMAGEKAEQR